MYKKICISVSVLPLVMSLCMCVWSIKPDFDNRFPLPHTAYVYIKLCVGLLLAFQCLFVYQCVTSMYVLKYMAKSVCVCVGVWLRRTCTARGLALRLLHQRNLASSRIRLCPPLLPPLAGP